MAITTDKGVEDILFEQGKLPKDKLSLVKLEAINTGKPVEELILDHNFVSLEDLTAARGEILGISFVNPTVKPISAEVLQLIPEPVARRYVLIPFEYDKSTQTLSVSMYQSRMPRKRSWETESGPSVIALTFAGTM